MSRRRRPLWARRPGTASAFRGPVAGPVHAPALWWRRRETQVRPGRCGLARRLGIIMPVELVNKDPRYSKVHLIDPAPLGYLHLAAEVQAAHRPGPVLRRSRDKQQLLGVLKWQARQLAGLDGVERVTVYDAVVFAPPGGDVKDRPATLPAAWFDVAVLAETSSPEAAREVRAAPAWQALAAALTERARRVHEVAARNVRR